MTSEPNPIPGPPERFELGLLACPHGPEKLVALSCQVPGPPQLSRGLVSRPVVRLHQALLLEVVDVVAADHLINVWDIHGLVGARAGDLLDLNQNPNQESVIQSWGLIYLTHTNRHLRLGT